MFAGIIFNTKQKKKRNTTTAIRNQSKIKEKLKTNSHYRQEV